MSDRKATKRGADLRIPRRATAIAGDDTPSTRPLEQWSDVDAYVLLGDPGAGKSEALHAESGVCGGHYISARDFIALGIPTAAVGKTLFIDGLDEVRAGSSGGLVPLDAIRARLKDLGYPRFRLSCREHDWQAQSDEIALQMVVRSGVVQVLHIEPLSRDEQLEILQARFEEVPDANDFLQQAERHGLNNLFGNPLLLDLTIRAVAAQGGWPESRRRIYELACNDLAKEYSVGRRSAKPLQPGDIDTLLDDAGLLCAILLLGGKGAITNALEESSDSTVAWHTLPAELTFHNAPAALGSKVFSAAAGGFAPRHRSIAEYLAAQAVAKRIRNGLPVGRVLALMTGRDGRVVEPLRGLLGWLAVHDSVNRQLLVRLDPLSMVLNGDVGAFGTDDKRVLLRALRDEAQRNRWFRNGQWVSHPFAPLATPDMAGALQEILANHAVEGSHQALVDCVLDALRHGARMPQLRKVLEDWVEDADAWIDNRIAAFRAWKNTIDPSPDKEKYWLRQLREGHLRDVDGRLSGALLADLYPDHVRPEEVLDYWPRSGEISANTHLPDFWWRGLVHRTRPGEFAALIDAWLRVQPKSRDSRHVYEWADVCSEILAGALENSGDLVDDARLHAWLGIGIGEHEFSVLRDGKRTDRIAQWLSDHPDRIKAVTRLFWSAVEPDPSTGKRYYWAHAERMYGARLPCDWLQWLLQQADEASNDELACYCFSRVAGALVEPPPGFDLPTMEQVEAWVEEHKQRWPQAGEWLQSAWSSWLENNWRGDQYRRKRKHEAETLVQREARKNAIAPQISAVVAGAASPRLMHQIALAHEERFRDIRGDTPEARVQDYLVSDEATARAAIDGLTRVLEREDLPSVDEILKLEAKGREHYLRPAALVAARLVYQRNWIAVDQWSDSLLARLTAFWLTDGTGATPDWYTHAARIRPAIVAPILVRYALPRLRRKGPLFVAGLWSLAGDPDQAALARQVLQPLLEGFPLRASEDARRVLNQALLGALHVLDDETAADIVRRRLSRHSMDAVQRVCWLVANIPYQAGAVQTLINAVGQNSRRLTALGVALHEQHGLGRALKDAKAATVSQLIELLAPISEPGWESEGWVTPAHERRDTVRSLIRSLESSPVPEAGEELRRLANLSRLQPWADQLRFSLLSQQSVSREAHYVHPSPRAAALTMANLGPANRADLKALTLDHLQDIEQQLRGADTFALRLFWREGGGRTQVPKIENECRDLLLDRLRERLRSFDVHVIPERRAADEKRVDVRIELVSSGQHMAVPIEIKKEDNKELWSAWRDQLQRLYAIDPAAGGNGIYIALWFGHKPKSSPEGVKPLSAKDLQRFLVERIPEADRGLIAVCVLDLSLPASNLTTTSLPHR